MSDNQDREKIIIDLEVNTDKTLNKLNKLSEDVKITASRVKLEVEDIFRKVGYKADAFPIKDTAAYAKELEKIVDKFHQLSTSGEKSAQHITAAWSEMQRQLKKAAEKLDYGPGQKGQFKGSVSEYLRQQGNVLKAGDQKDIAQARAQFEALSKMLLGKMHASARENTESILSAEEKMNKTRQTSLEKEGDSASRLIAAEASKAARQREKEIKSAARERFTASKAIPLWFQGPQEKNPLSQSEQAAAYRQQARVRKALGGFESGRRTAIDPSMHGGVQSYVDPSLVSRSSAYQKRVTTSYNASEKAQSIAAKQQLKADGLSESQVKRAQAQWERMTERAIQSSRMKTVKARVNLDLQAGKINTDELRRQVAQEIRRTSAGTQFKNLVNVLAFGQLTESLRSTAATMVDAAGSFEQYEKTLNVVVKDPKRSKELNDFLIKYEALTSYDLREVMQTGISLSTTESVRGLKAAGLTVEDAVKMSGELGALRPGATISEAQNALSKVIAGSNEGLEILRNQFGLSNAVLERFGVFRGPSGYSLQTQDERNRAIQAIQAYQKETTGGNLAIEQSQTLKGLLSTLGSQVFKTLAAVFEPFVPVAKSLTKSMIGFLESVEKMPAALKIFGTALVFGATGISSAGQLAASTRLLGQAVFNAFKGNRGPGDVEASIFKVLSRNGIRGSERNRLVTTFLQEMGIYATAQGTGTAGGMMFGQAVGGAKLKPAPLKPMQVLARQGAAGASGLLGGAGNILGTVSMGAAEGVGMAGGAVGASKLAKTTGWMQKLGKALKFLINPMNTVRALAVGVTWAFGKMAAAAAALAAAPVVTTIAAIVGTVGAGAMLFNRYKRDADYSRKSKEFYSTQVKFPMRPEINGQDGPAMQNRLNNIERANFASRVKDTKGGLRDFRSDPSFRKELLAREGELMSTARDKMMIAERDFGVDSKQFVDSKKAVDELTEAYKSYKKELKSGTVLSRDQVSAFNDLASIVRENNYGGLGLGMAEGLEQSLNAQQFKDAEKNFLIAIDNHMKQGQTRQKAIILASAEEAGKIFRDSLQAMNADLERNRAIHRGLLMSAVNSLSADFALREGAGEVNIDDQIANSKEKARRLDVIASTYNASTAEGRQQIRDNENQVKAELANTKKLQFMKTQEARKAAIEHIKLAVDERQGRIAELNFEMIHFKKQVTDQVEWRKKYSREMLAIERDYQIKVAEMRDQNAAIRRESILPLADFKVSEADRLQQNLQQMTSKLSPENQARALGVLVVAQQDYVKALEAQTKAQKEQDTANTEAKIASMLRNVNPNTPPEIRAQVRDQVNAEREALKARNDMLDKGLKVRKEELDIQREQATLAALQQRSEQRYATTGKAFELQRRQLEMIAGRDKLEEKGGLRYLENLKQRYELEKAQQAMEVQNQLNNPNLDEAQKENLLKQNKLDLIDLQQKYLDMAKKSTDEVQKQIDKMNELKKLYYNEDGNTMGETFGIADLNKNMQTDSDYFRLKAGFGMGKEKVGFNGLTGQQSQLASMLGIDPTKITSDLKKGTSFGGQIGAVTEADLISRLGPEEAKKIIDKFRINNPKDMIEGAELNLPGFSGQGFTSVSPFQMSGKPGDLLRDLRVQNEININLLQGGKTTHTEKKVFEDNFDPRNKNNPRGGKGI